MATIYPAQANSPQTSLSAAVTASGTTLTLADASVLPAPPNLAVIGVNDECETIRYTGKSGNTLTGVTRAFEGTAKAWPSGSVIARNFTAWDFNNLSQEMESRVRTDDFSNLVPIHTFAPNPDPLDPGDWIVTPTIGNPDKLPTTGMTIRAIFNTEWTAFSKLWFAGRLTTIGPAGVYPPGIYLLTLNTLDLMYWWIQGAEPIGPTADRIAAKADRQDTASVITGTAAGEVAHLPDAAAGTCLRSLTIGGKTAETGTGEKGPQNPYTLAGIQPAMLTVSGKNLLDLSRIDFSDGCTYTIDGVVLTVTKTTSAVGSYCAVLTMHLDPGTYHIKANSVSSDGAGAGIAIAKGKNFVFNQSTSADPAGAFTLSDAGEVKVYFYVSRNGAAGTTTTFTCVQLGRGAAATEYEPYSGAVYPLPITAPLFGLPDGTADTYSADGSQVICIGRMTLTPDMMWSDMERANTTRYISKVLTDIAPDAAYNAVLCNFLPTAEDFTADAVGVCLHEGRVVLSLPGSWDRDTFNNWLAVLSGAPVVVYYPVAEPTATQLDGITVTVPALDTYISAHGAPTTTEYNKDTMAVIAALTARIAALEGGGGA